MFFALVLLASLSWAVFGLHNVTVQDNESAVVYIGSWTSLSYDFDSGGTHHFTTYSGGSASLTFTGVAVYFMSPLWSYTVNTQITLDSGVPVVIDLVDHSGLHQSNGPTVQSHVIWGVSGLNNTAHTVVASMAPQSPYVVVDAFIYTVLEPEDNTVTPATSSKSSVGSATSSASPSAGREQLAAALGTALGVVGIAAIVVAFLLYRRCRRPSTPAAGSSVDDISYPVSAAPSPSEMTTIQPFPANSAFLSQPYPAAYAGAGQGFDSTDSPHMPFNAPRTSL